MEYLNMDVVRRIDKRILVSPHLKTFLKKIYSRNNIPSDYIDRTHVILNGVSVASLPALEKFDEKLKVIYVARNAVEKRIYLVCKIANEIQKMNLPIAFTMAGPDPDNWQDEGSDNITWLGLVSDENKIMELYSVHQIFLLTSSTEGMPKTMIEAMAAGCIPLVSAVGAIMDYVKDGFNGYLLPAMPEDELIRKAVTNLKNFCENPILIAEMRINAFETVKKNFDINICEHLYRRIIVPPSA
jgi:glycosyltransferase involved in cell wall biosynthesis